MATLNKQKPYAEVCGGYGRVRYEQDGKGFDVNGDEVFDEPEEVTEVVQAEPRKRGRKPNVETRPPLHP